MLNIVYVFYFILLILILFYLFFKYKYKFWILQPVFHYYDISYWFYDKGIINEHLPIKNKYVNVYDIKTCVVDDIVKKSDMQKFIFLIKKHYLRNKENKFYPESTNITPYFSGHNSPCFISIFYEKQLLKDKTQDIIENKTMIGATSSRPLHVNFAEKSFDAYYVDYLCVDKTKRKMGIAPQIIQTHEYNQRHSNHNIVVSLFKREGELTGIVPICVYNTHCFNLTHLKLSTAFPPSLKLLVLDSQNIHHLFHFIKNNIQQFDLRIYPEMSNLLELVTSKNIKIFMVLDNQDITAVYFFRKTCTFIEAKKELLSCFASIKSNNISSELFVQIFEYTLSTISRYFGYVCVENISNNDIILTHWEKVYKPIVVSPCAYFFYNYAYHTLNPNKVLILN